MRFGPLSGRAASGHLVTFGVAPAYAETGYGYIKASGLTGVSDDGRRVERFVEKPDAAEAAGYLEEGGYYWNSGMFVFSASRYLRELGVHATRRPRRGGTGPPEGVEGRRLPSGWRRSRSPGLRPSRWITRSWNALPAP